MKKYFKWKCSKFAKKSAQFLLYRMINMIIATLEVSESFLSRIAGFLHGSTGPSH